MEHFFIPLARFHYLLQSIETHTNPNQYICCAFDGHDRRQQIQELKDTLHRYGRGHIADAAIEKKDLLDATLDLVTTSLPDLISDKYDLVANITHDSPADVGREGLIDPLQEGSYKCHVQHRGTKQWYEIQDFHVQEVMPQQISVSESYLLIFERKSARLDSRRE